MTPSQKQAILAILNGITLGNSGAYNNDQAVIDACDYLRVAIDFVPSLDAIDRTHLPDLGWVLDIVKARLAGSTLPIALPNPIGPVPVPAPTTKLAPTILTPIKNALNWLFKRPLRLPGKQARGLDKTFNLPSGSTESANDAVAGIAEGVVTSAATTAIKKEASKL